MRGDKYTEYLIEHRSELCFHHDLPYMRGWRSLAAAPLGSHYCSRWKRAVFPWSPVWWTANIFFYFLICGYFLCIIYRLSVIIPIWLFACYVCGSPRLFLFNLLQRSRFHVFNTEWKVKCCISLFSAELTQWSHSVYLQNYFIPFFISVRNVRHRPCSCILSFLERLLLSAQRCLKEFFHYETDSTIQIHFSCKKHSRPPPPSTKLLKL